MTGVRSRVAVPIVNTVHDRPKDTRQPLTIRRLNAPIHHIATPKPHGAKRFVAMIDQAQRIDVENLAPLVEVKPASAGCQLVELVLLEGDDFVVDLEGDAAVAFASACQRVWDVLGKSMAEGVRLRTSCRIRGSFASRKTGCFGGLFRSRRGRLQRRLRRQG